MSSMHSEKLKPDAKRRYGIALGTIIISLFITWNTPLLLHRHAFDLFQGAVFLSAWYGGFGPGLVSIILSILAIDYFFLPPIHSFSLGITDMIRLSIFGVVALITGSLSAKLRAAQSQLQQAHDNLEHRLAERTQEVLTISSREQERIGQDIHDGLCQTLTGTRFLTQALQKKLSTQKYTETEDLAKIEAGLEIAQTQAETVSRGLYPVELETDGLMSALQELTDRISNVYPVVCQFICRRPIPVYSHEQAVHLFRITQEAVSNAIKGGKAHHITVRLLTLGQNSVLLIADDGIGFLAETNRKGMGLKIMNYRAYTIGAKLKIRARRKGGTSVACIFSQLLRPQGDTA